MNRPMVVIIKVYVNRYFDKISQPSWFFACWSSITVFKDSQLPRTFHLDVVYLYTFLRVALFYIMYEGKWGRAHKIQQIRLSFTLNLEIITFSAITIQGLTSLWARIPKYKNAAFYFYGEWDIMIATFRINQHQPLTNCILLQCLAEVFESTSYCIFTSDCW